MNILAKQSDEFKERASNPNLSNMNRLSAKVSMQKILSFSFTAQIVLVIAIIIGILFHGSKQTEQAFLKEMRQEVLARVAQQLERHIEEPIQLNLINVGAWQSGLLDLSDASRRERHFVNSIRAFPHAAMTFVGLGDGSFYGARRKASGEIQIVRNNKETGGDSWYYSVSPDGEGQASQEVFRNFDPRGRPWYKNVQAIGGPTFSEVYRHFVFLEPTITASQPVYDENGRLAGVFGVDYLLSWLGDTLSSIPVGKSGQVFITDAEGFLVATSSPSEVFTEKDGRLTRVKATEAKDAVLRSAAESIPKAADGGAGEIEHENKLYLVDSKSFRKNGIDWNIFVVLAKDDFTGDIKAALNKTLAITFAAIIIALIIAVRTARWITQPILRLNAAARQLSEGRLDTLPGTDRQDELGQLTVSFNAMAHQIVDLVGGLEKKVEERTAALAEKTEEEQKLRRRLHAELAEAGSAQRSMLPEAIDQAKIRLEIIYEPYLLVSGDFCGYQWLKEGDVLFGYIIDVTGHGAAAALQTAAINAMIQETLYYGYPLAKAMAELNKRAVYYLRDESMVAAVCFQIDFARRKLSYVAAGVTEFFADAIGASGRIKAPGSFLGLTDTPEFEEVSLDIAEGDIFCFYTDGITDKLGAVPALAGGRGFDETLQAFRRIVADGKMHDDCTAIVIQIKNLP